VKFFHNIETAGPVNLAIDGETILYNLANGEFSAYTKIPSPNNCSKILEIVDSITGEVYAAKKISPKTGYCTSMITSINGLPSVKTFSTHTGCAKVGMVNVRLIHASSKTPPVEVRDATSCLIKKLEYLESSSYLEISLKKGPSKVNLVIDPENAKTILPIKLPSEAGQTYSVFVTNGAKLYVTKDNIPLCEMFQSNLCLSKMSGRWCTVLSLPQEYKKCLDSVIELTLLTKNIKMVTYCQSKPEKRMTVFGKPLKEKALWAMEFPDVPYAEDKANLIVHSTDYKNYAIFGSPDRSMLYIMGRHTSLPQKTLKETLEFSKHAGYDISKLQIENKKNKHY